MNAIVQTINSTGRDFVNFALPMLIQSSVLIAILLLVDLALRRRVRAFFRYWIWLLVLVKLVLPPSLWSPVSFGTWLGATLEVPAVVLQEPTAPPREAQPPGPAWQPQAPLGDGASLVQDQADRGPWTALEGDAASIQPPQAGQAVATRPGASAKGRPATAAISEPPVSLSWQGLTLLAWAAVATALLLLLIQRASFVRGLVAQAGPATEHLQEALAACRQRMGRAGPLALRISANATSPAVCGLLRPTILIPQSLVGKLQRRDLEAVLLHELAHIKRGDLWINLAQTLLQIVYFYNPLLWLANAMIRRVREQAVDEAVLVALGESARQYPETLVNIAKLAFRRRPALSLRLIGVVESKSALRSRIKHILNRPLPKTARLSLLGMVVLFLTGAVLLPMAQARPLTDRARAVMVLAEQEARALNHAYVGTEHILLALARQEDAVSAKVLQNLGVRIATLRAEVDTFVQPGSEPAGRRPLAQTARARRVLEYAREQAKALGHDYVGTEHILLGLARDGEGIAAQILSNLGLTSTRLNREVLEFVRPGPRSRRVYLPDLETPDANVVLDLATGRLLSAAPMQHDERVFARLGKGDIAYEYVDGKSGLLCLRGARLTRRTDTGIEPSTPDVTREAFVVYFIEDVPARYRVATAEGDTYDLDVLSIDPGDRGGALVEFAPTAGSADVEQIIRLSDVDVRPEMLDLATGESVALPQAAGPNEIWQAIERIGQGDLVYDSHKLILVRHATSPQAHTGPVAPFRTYEIALPLPKTLTVTTAEGRSYWVTISSADDNACMLVCSPVPASDGDGGPASLLQTRAVPDAREYMLQLGLAAVLYTKEHDGDLPADLGLLKPYLSEPDVFAWLRKNTLFMAYAGRDNVRDYPDPAALPIAFQKVAGSRTGRYVAHYDGHVQSVESAPQEPPGPLQHLIDEAAPRATVTVPKGTYVTPIEISKPLVLRGASADGCIIEVTADGPAVAIDLKGQGSVTVENLTVKWQRATSERAERPYALWAKDSDVTIRNCRFVPLGNNQRCPVAARFDGFCNATLDDCRFTGFEYTVCYGPGSEGVVRDCLVVNPGHQGVTGYENSTLRVERTIVIGSGYHGLRCTGGTLHARDNILADNRVSGIYLGNKDGRGTVIGNLMLRNATAVAGYYRAEFSIENNVISDSAAAGVGMWSTCRLNVRRNVFEGNAAALVVYPKGTQDTNIIGRNLFWQNGANAKDCTLAADSILADPQFADPNAGDFSTAGPAREQKQGLTDPPAIRQLWPRYEQAQRERPADAYR